jgi:hypothetical protein
VSKSEFIGRFAPFALMVVAVSAPDVAQPQPPNKAPIERQAYETYVGCWNQSLRLERNSPDADSLRNELQGCRQLARRVLAESRSRLSDTYLAHLLLLGTDGGESEQNNEVVARRRATILPALQALEKRTPTEQCLVPGTVLTDPDPGLCASPDQARGTIDLHLAALRRKRPH